MITGQSLRDLVGNAAIYTSLETTKNATQGQFYWFLIWIRSSLPIFTVTTFVSHEEIPMTGLARTVQYVVVAITRYGAGKRSEKARNAMPRLSPGLRLSSLEPTPS